MTWKYPSTPTGLTDLAVTGNTYLQGLSQPITTGNSFLVVDTTTAQIFRRPRPTFFTEQF